MAEGADKKNSDGSPPRPDPPGYFEGESMTRRAVFGLGVQGFGIMAVSAVALPAVGFALAPVFEREEELWQGVGPLEDFTSETYTVRVITIVEGIGEAGKTTVYVRRGDPGLSEQEPDLPPEGPDDIIAISTRCAHLGCPVRYVQAASNFICPCHGGVYDFQGKVAGGPPVRPLDRFYTRVRGDRVEVGPRYSVNSELKRFDDYRDPAQDLDGIGQYLYPPRFSTPKLD